MPKCDNCGEDSNLILAVEVKGVIISRYCSLYVCMEAAKNMIGDIKNKEKLSGKFKKKEESDED